MLRKFDCRLKTTTFLPNNLPSGKMFEHWFYLVIHIYILCEFKKKRKLKQSVTCEYRVELELSKLITHIRTWSISFAIFTSFSFFSASSLRFGSNVLDKIVASCGISILRDFVRVNWNFFPHVVTPCAMFSLPATLPGKMCHAQCKAVSWPVWL